MKYAYIIRPCYDHWILKDSNSILLIFTSEFCVNASFSWRYVKDILCAFLILRSVNISYNLSLDTADEHGGFALETRHDGSRWCSVKPVPSEFCCSDIKVFKFAITKLHGKSDFKKLSSFVSYFRLATNGSSGCWRKSLMRKLSIDGWASRSRWSLVKGSSLLKLSTCRINLLTVGLLSVTGSSKPFPEEVGTRSIRNSREPDRKLPTPRGWATCTVSLVPGSSRTAMDVTGKILAGIG